MKYLWFCFLLSFLLISCNTENKNASIYDFISEDASVILNTNTIESLASNLNNSDLINAVAPTPAYKKLTGMLSGLEYLNTTNSTIISLLKDDNDSLQYVFATKFTADVFNTDSIPNVTIVDATAGKYAAKRITYNNSILFTSIKDSILVGSSNVNALASVLSSSEKSENKTVVDKLLNTTNRSNHLSVVINATKNNFITSLFNSDVLPFSDFTNYLAFDTEITQDQMVLNGITKATDSTNSLINVFKNTIPQENELAKIAPSNSDGFLSFTFDTFSVFKNNLDAFNSNASDSISIPLFDNIIEVGTIFENNNTAIVLNSIDVISTKDALLSEQNSVDNYRQIPIYSFSMPSFFKDVFAPLVSFDNAQFYCVIDQFFVFANSLDAIQNIIANYQNKTTLASRGYYKSSISNLSSAASILYVTNAASLKQILETNLNAAIEASLKSYKSSALQFIYDTNYAHFNAIIKKNKSKAVSNAVTEVLNIKLDANVLNTPHFVTNHRTRGKDIVVQDVNHKLYLISNTGSILWKRQLNGPILGAIKQIDIYKNGRLQLAFATPNRVYLISRDGKDVTGYPLEFNDIITQPLSVFDYDKNKNYRLFVTQGKSVLLYDAKGKSVKGFKFKSADATINSQPQHIRMGSKDFILIKTDNKLNILSRRGTARVTVKNQLKYSKEPIYNYKNTFTTTTTDGNLVSIDQSGNVKTTPLQLSEGHNITATSKTLVTLNDNKLTIKGKTIDLDFATYSEPKLFYINDKIYVSVTDLQSQKVLLFDSQAKSIANFPVYGNSSIDLNNIDKDRSLEFVTKGENNSILVYEIN